MPKAAEPVKPTAEPAKPEPAANQLTLEALKVPEGFTIDPGLGTELVTTINQHAGNPTALANALIGLQVKAQSQASETASREWDTLQNDWKKQSEADPEIGGAKYAANVAASKQLITQFGGEKLQQVLETTGAGNHPEFLRFMSRIAPSLLEARPVTPATPQPAKKEYSSTNLYPN